MNRDLTSQEIDDVLRQQCLGRLGCLTTDDRIYVVPVTFAYHEDFLYSFTYPGLKLEALRHHPSVCMQVDQFLVEETWKSVIAWGTYEELADKEEFLAMKIIMARLEQEHGTAVSPLYAAAKVAKESLIKVRDMHDAAFYRIRIEQKTGKYIHYE